MALPCDVVQDMEWVTTELDVDYSRKLSHYVRDPMGLRGTLRLLGAVISGSFALSFLLRGQDVTFTPSDMDIYTPKDNAMRLVAYLTNIEGYVHVSTSTVPYGRSTAHKLVLVLAKGDARIDVIPSVNDNALYPLAHFWSSHVMNFLTADTFCVGYPDLTFSGRVVLAPLQLIDHRYPSKYIVSLITKYAGRGFDFRVRPYAWDTDERQPDTCSLASCPRVRRFFGDRFCVMGSLSRAYPVGGYSRMLPSPTTVCWWRGGDACGGACVHSDVFPECAWPTAYNVLEQHLPYYL